MLLEIIFKGSFSILDLKFLKEQLENAKAVRFSYPENITANNFNEVNKIFSDNEYVDLAITSDRFFIYENAVPKVFINLVKDQNNMELLIFFDLNDINKENTKIAIDYLISWTALYRKKYNFDYCICQMDNADKNEYYFDSNGNGPLYDGIGS